MKNPNRSIEVETLPGGILFRVSSTASVFGAIVNGIAAGIFIWMMVGAILGETPLKFFSILGLLVSYYLSRRTRFATLRVMEHEFVSTGRVGDGIGSVRTVATIEICRLEYQEGTTGPDDSSHPGGLYAVTGRRSVCLIPGVNEIETENIVRTIMTRFPNLEGPFAKESPPKSRFTVLGLSPPSKSDQMRQEALGSESTGRPD
jgi:hypothetical protein